MVKKYAIIGLGYISSKHMDAIEETGGKLIVGCDIDSNKVRKLPKDVEFFTNWKAMMTGTKLFDEVDIVSICTPNYLHYPMISVALKQGKTIICEKPVTISPAQAWTLGNRVNVVLQLRYSPVIQQIRETCKPEGNVAFLDIHINRGEWYHNSWKGNEEKSGGLLMNIGIHYFDLLIHLFGSMFPEVCFPWKAGVGKDVEGKLINGKGSVIWRLNITAEKDNQYRVLYLNGEKFNLDRGFENLHTKVYEEVLAGRGVKPVQVLNSLCCVNDLRVLLQKTI